MFDNLEYFIAIFEPKPDCYLSILNSLLNTLSLSNFIVKKVWDYKVDNLYLLGVHDVDW